MDKIIDNIEIYDIRTPISYYNVTMFIYSETYR